MKIKILLPFFFIFNGIVADTYCQISTAVVRAWGVEETMIGGAPPPEMEKPMNRTTRRFFLETKPGSKVTIAAVWIGKTAFQVIEEPYSQDDSKSNMIANATSQKNNFIQVVVTNTLETSCSKPVLAQLKGNEAVIAYSISGKKYYAPIKALQHTQLNLP